jgi:gliding motility-associated-like protein
MAMEDGNRLAKLDINALNNSVTLDTLNDNLGVDINALGFRSADNLLYGIGTLNHRLYRIDAGGSVEDLGALALNSNYFYFAGDVSPDGRYLFAIGSVNGIDKTLEKIDLAGSYAVQSSLLPGAMRITDIAFDPTTGGLYGYDRAARKIVQINVGNNVVTSLAEINIENDIQGLFFDAFGNLFAYGSTIFGVASALFAIDKNTGQEITRSTGPVYPIRDLASCPYSVDMHNAAIPKVVFPCSEITYAFPIANSSGSTQAGVDFEHKLPPGFNYVEIVQNPFGGTVVPAAPANFLRIENMSLPKGADSLIIKVEVGDIPGGNYKSQASLKNLPQPLGGFRLSDNPETAALTDSTAVRVNRIDEDSLVFNRFLCLGETMVLDAGDYGADLVWNNGSTSPQLVVSQQGQYTLEANSGCQSLSVSYNVTVASCPYTIRLMHKIVPEETFSCSEVVFRYIIDNASGLRREGVGFANELPAGVGFVDFLSDPLGGTLEPDLPPGIVRIKGMSVPLGIDSFDILVEVGELAPGTYRNRAIINNLPQIMGPFRFSDDPRTMPHDSTTFKIVGAGADSLRLELLWCRGDTLALDGSEYGKTLLWEDGSTAELFFVTAPGEYRLTVLDGCDPSLVVFSVAEGDPVYVEIPRNVVDIHLGETHRLSPQIANYGDTTIVEWTDPPGNSLSCLDCLNPTAMPLESALYTLKVSNEVCTDSATVAIRVDKTRRVFAPNAFSPNLDGVNDIFFLQSPDFGLIKSMTISDRWGNFVFHASNIPLNDPAGGWNGRVRGRPVASGVFVWRAEIEFLDGVGEVFFGDVAVVR